LDKVFANFQIDNDFYLIVFLFLLITMIISTVIVISVSKIQTLTAILERAKEIDHAKEERIAFLDEHLSEEKMQNFTMKRELEHFEDMKERFHLSERTLSKLRNELNQKEKKYIDKIHAQKSVLDELRIHHKLSIEQLERIEEEYFLLRQSNEHLMDNNNLLHTQNRELEVRFSEQKKQNIEKIQMMEEHRGELKEEFSELASKIFESNSK
jgi:DNA recombination protein RmuC